MPAIRAPREAFSWFYPLATRWMDNDMFGHVNNVQYYSFFDTTVAQYLIQSGWMNLASSDVVGLVIETRCTYHASVSFPDELEVGLRVERMGNSSVRYGLGVFKRGESQASAEGYFVHVYVDRATHTPVKQLPDALRHVLQPLVMDSLGDAK